MKLLGSKPVWGIVVVFLAWQYCLLGVTTAAEPVTINFDTFPDGTPVPEGTTITNQYENAGVIVVSEDFNIEDVSGNSNSFAGASLPNVLTPEGFAPGPGASLGCNLDFKARFVSPVSSVSILVFAGASSPPKTIRLVAKDLDENTIDQDSFVVTTLGFPQPSSATLTVSSSTLNIASIETVGVAGNDVCIALDNLSFSQRIAPCTLNVGATFTDGTLTLTFSIGTQEPATWNVWLTSRNEIVRLVLASLPVIDPPTSVQLSIPSFPPMGTIGFLTTLTTPTEGIICSDLTTVNTGPITPPAPPTAQQLRELFRPHVVGLQERFPNH